MRWLWTLILLSALAVAQQPRTEARARTGGERANVSKSDGELEKTIKAKFAKSKISKNGFTVQVKDGIATIEGETDVVQHKGTATRLARTAGARQVVNNIRVSDGARKKAAEPLGKPRKAVVKPAAS